jgi:hypothetical protein
VRLVPAVIRNSGKEIKIGVENELLKDQFFRKIIENLRVDQIKGKKKYFITIA